VNALTFAAVLLHPGPRGSLHYTRPSAHPRVIYDFVSYSLDNGIGS
jgi:hypothetical protein